MATTLRTELTAAGCNVATATIIFQDGLGRQPGIGKNEIAPTARNGRSVTNGVDPVLDKKFINGAGQTQIPRCMAIDATAVYIWYAPVNGDGRFMRFLTALTSYTSGNNPIPVLGPH